MSTTHSGSTKEKSQSRQVPQNRLYVEWYSYGKTTRRYQYTAIDDATRIRAVRVYRRRVYLCAVYLTGKLTDAFDSVRKDAVVLEQAHDNMVFAMSGQARRWRLAKKVNPVHIRLKFDVPPEHPVDAAMAPSTVSL